MTSLVFRPQSTPPESTPSSSSAAVRAIPLPLPLPVPAVLELSTERWERWVATGRAQDRAVRRRFQIGAGIVAVLAMAALLLWTL